MAGIETYGGCCPKCLRGMEQKWESSMSGLMFDACVWCGFIYIGEGIETSKDEATNAWNSIFDHYGVSNKEELIKKNNYLPHTLKENTEFFPSIFNYSNDPGTLLMYKMLWNKQNTKDTESPTVEGLRVSWHEDNNEGTLMSYEEGKVYILWDEHKGSKLPYFDYDATEVGNKIQVIAK